MHLHSTVEIASVCYAEAEEPIHRIRCTVFQDEQGVAPELEFDGLDASAEHLLAYLDGQPVGTARLRAVTEETIAIERLAVLPSARGRGLGTRLMQAALQRATERGFRCAALHAQEYVVPLYQRLGFAPIGDRFEEAGIPHVKMEKLLP